MRRKRGGRRERGVKGRAGVGDWTEKMKTNMMEMKEKEGTGRHVSNLNKKNSGEREKDLTEEEIEDTE